MKKWESTNAGSHDILRRVGKWTDVVGGRRGTIVGDWTFMALFVVTVVLVRHAAHARLNWLVAEVRA